MARDIPAPTFTWRADGNGGTELVVRSHAFRELTSSEITRVSEAMQDAVEHSLARSVGAEQIPAPRPAPWVVSR